MRTTAGEPSPTDALRLAAFGGHFYAPVALGWSRHSGWLSRDAFRGIRFTI